eukprot:TRINITY_DN5738_c0_g1_i4.p1 TRINITY_DN5738_c0_g1~~TRINITY_DN5738_c0_g1_i4.p1  ORF type:complete len:351 (-),score=28.67 TRINITY_DN5738_c0_g1_i4:42-1094(-)
MGAKSSSAAKGAKSPSEAQASQPQLIQPHQKWLLLGAGEVGKSTIFKNIILYHQLLTSQDSRPFFSELQCSTLGCMQSLLRCSDKLSVRLGNAISPDLAEEKKIVESLPDAYDRSGVYTVEVAAAVYRLWQDPFIQQCYAMRHGIHSPAVPDSAAYLFERARQYADSSYAVTPLDILHVVIRTIGVIQQNMFINGRAVSVFDTGGQRAERKKWIHLFDGQPTILFVAALSEYNQMVWEDDTGTSNRLIESLELFESLAQPARQLSASRFVLILNKVDVFRTRIQTYHLCDYLPDYNGPQQDADAAQDWIVQQFRNRMPTGRQLDVFFTTATDIDETRATLTRMFDILVPA